MSQQKGIRQKPNELGILSRAGVYGLITPSPRPPLKMPSPRSPNSFLLLNLKFNPQSLLHSSHQQTGRCKLCPLPGLAWHPTFQVSTLLTVTRGHAFLASFKNTFLCPINTTAPRGSSLVPFSPYRGPPLNNLHHSPRSWLQLPFISKWLLQLTQRVACYPSSPLLTELRICFEERCALV